MEIYHASNGVLEYTPTDDGAFEKWIDVFYPQWESSPDIDLYRELWEASRLHYSAEVL